jgi:hemerythrin-like domain-containing protein
MLPIIDLKGEHEAMMIIINAMKRFANDILQHGNADMFRISQIYDFLQTYVDHCHYEKEEQYFFPALLEYDKPWVFRTINKLITEHNIARSIIREIGYNLNEYILGKTLSLTHLSANFTDFVKLEEHHMSIEDDIVLPFFEKIFDKKRMGNIATEFKLLQDQNVGPAKQIEYYRLLSKLYSENSLARN